MHVVTVGTLCRYPAARLKVAPGAEGVTYAIDPLSPGRRLRQQHPSRSRPPSGRSRRPAPGHHPDLRDRGDADRPADRQAHPGHVSRPCCGRPPIGRPLPGRPGLAPRPHPGPIRNMIPTRSRLSYVERRLAGFVGGGASPLRRQPAPAPAHEATTGGRGAGLADADELARAGAMYCVPLGAALFTSQASSCSV